MKKKILGFSLIVWPFVALLTWAVIMFGAEVLIPIVVVVLIILLIIASFVAGVYLSEDKGRR